MNKEILNKEILNYENVQDKTIKNWKQLNFLKTKTNLKKKKMEKNLCRFYSAYKCLLDNKFNRRRNHQKKLDMNWKWKICFKDFTKK